MLAIGTGYPLGVRDVVIGVFGELLRGVGFVGVLCGGDGDGDGGWCPWVPTCLWNS